MRFFHVADAHFGVENYGRIDQKTGLHSRFLDFVQSFEACVDQAIKEDVDFFLFCGDAYKTAYPTPTQQKQLLRLLFKLQQANIPTVIIVGNHDHPLSFGKTHALDVFNTVPLDGIKVFAKPDSIELKTKSGIVNIVGIPWPLKHNILTKQEHRFKNAQEITSYISEKVGMIIQDFADKIDNDHPSILAGHLTVSSGVFSGSEKCAVFGNDPLFLPSQLAIKPFDYVALGHLHRHQDLNKNGVPVVYSGSIERIDFGERKEKKGFCKVTLDSSEAWGERAEYTFIELPTRPMVQIEVKLDKERSQTKQILEAIAKKNIVDAVVKIVYHVPKGTLDKVDIFEVHRACAPALCIASINPVIKYSTRQSRAEINVSMDFAAMVDKYLDSKEDWPVDRKTLKEKALKLYDELQSQLLESEDQKLVKPSKRKKEMQGGA